MNITRKIKITKIENGIKKEQEEEIVSEYSLSIFVNDVFLATLLCSKCCLKELTIGHLYTNKIISNINEISGIVLEEKENESDINIYLNDSVYEEKKSYITKKIITTSNGRQYSYFDDMLSELEKEDVTSGLFSSEEIFEEVESFVKSSEVFKKTGGVHGCKLIARTGESILMEDIGRHNAFDKIIGYALINDIEFGKSLVITSGRIPSDMVVKAVLSKIPILVSKSAPTDISVKLASELGLTLVGFVREKRMNIYSLAERIG